MEHSLKDIKNDSLLDLLHTGKDIRNLETFYRDSEFLKTKSYVQDENKAKGGTNGNDNNHSFSEVNAPSQSSEEPSHVNN